MVLLVFHVLGAVGPLTTGALAQGHDGIVPPKARTTEGLATEAEAVVYGVVYPRGHLTRYWFQWGRTPRYGHVTEVSEETVGPDFGPKEVEEGLSGLHPRTTYHFRIVARNAGGRPMAPTRASGRP